MLGEMSVEGDTEVGRAPEVGSVNEKVGKSGGFRGAEGGTRGHARLV